MRSKIDPMKEMAGTLRRHRVILLNGFHGCGASSNGSVKGMNNKAKLTIRKDYGFRSYKTLETALYH
jgi:transposase